MPSASTIASPAVLSYRRASANKTRIDAIVETRDERLRLGGQLTDYRDNLGGFQDTVERERSLRRGLILTLLVAAVVVTFDYFFAVGEVAGHMMQDYWQNRYGAAEMPAWVLNSGAIFLVAFISATTLFFSNRAFDTTELEVALRNAEVDDDAALRHQIRGKKIRKWCYLAVLAAIFGGLWTVSYDKARQAAENAAEDKRRDAEIQSGAAVSVSSMMTAESTEKHAPPTVEFAPRLSASQWLTLKCTAVALVLVFLGHLGLSGCPTYGVWQLPRPLFSERAADAKARRLHRLEKKDATALWMRITQLPDGDRQAAIDALPRAVALAINEAMEREVIGLPAQTRIPAENQALEPAQDHNRSEEPPSDDLRGVL